LDKWKEIDGGTRSAELEEFIEFLESKGIELKGSEPVSRFTLRWFIAEYLGVDWDQLQRERREIEMQVRTEAEQ